MRKTVLTILISAGIALGASGAMAAGLERSGQPVSLLFAEGNVAALSFGSVVPDVSGTDGTGQPTGQLAPRFSTPGAGVKFRINDRLDAALLLDRPFGLNTEYLGAPASFLYETTAALDSQALTVLLSFRAGERLRLYGGLSYQALWADFSLPYALNYTMNVSRGSGVGLVAGAAYEVPQSGLRVALTYRSQIRSTHAITESIAGGANVPGSMAITTPQSVTLDLAKALSPRTRLSGSLRWVDWSSFAIGGQNVGGPSILIGYVRDSISLRAGVDHALSDRLSLGFSLGYERPLGGIPNALIPHDGARSIGIGLAYAMGSATFTLEAQKRWLGDVADPGGIGVFRNNSTFGLKAGLRFSF